MQFQRKRNKQKQRIIFLSVLAVVIAALAVSVFFLSRALSNPEETEQTKGELIEILPEEGRNNSYPIAFPLVGEKDITIISIENEKGSYFMAVPPNSSSSSFEFYFDADEEGNYTYYSPDILKNDDGMIYDDLYAKVTGDGYDRIPMLTYLVAAIRSPYFDYRIYLSDDSEKRDAELKVYGLTPDGAAPADSESETSVRKAIHFWYTKEDGTLGEYVIEIGAHTVTGSGYYFRIGDGVTTKVDSDGDGTPDKSETQIVYRDYIYVTGETNYFKYALLGIEAYINPVLIASGLGSDQHAMYAPYLTPDYRQWKTELHKLGSLPSDSEGMKKVTDVFATVDAYIPVYVFEDGLINGTVEKSELGSYIFNLTELKNNKLYPYLEGALLGKEIGESVKQSVLYEKTVAEGKKYRYTVTDIESVITMTGENNTVGTQVGDNRYIRVTYVLYEYNSETEKYEEVKNITKVTTDEDGKTKLEYASLPVQGIIDLEYLKKIGVAEETINALNVVGDVGRVDIDVTYTKKNEAGESSGLAYRNMTYNLDAVLEIYEPEYDEEGKITSYERVNKLSDTSLVAFRYYYVADGKAESASIGYINMKADENESDHERLNKIRDAIKKWDKLVTKKPIEVLKENHYTDIASDFIFYVLNDISGFMTGEIVSAFRFVNVSERDPFYGESFYERTEDYMLYAMSQDACDKVVKLLGGLTDSSANGLAGLETVKVGITPEALEQYGCSANVVRYSLPRDLYVSVETAEDEYDDYSWLRTLDFVLYISESVWDPDTESWIKYVASEMYNIIVKVNADTFGFVDLDTVDFWARRNLILIDSKNVGQINVEFMMEDLKGRYQFLATHEPYTPSGAATEIDWMNIYPEKVGTSNFTTRFDEYVEYVGTLAQGHPDKEVYPSLEGFYNYLAGEPASEDGESRGTGMFKELLKMLYYTNYMGTLTEEAQAEALAGGPLMRFSVKLDDTYDSNANTRKEYYYEFYRCDDSRVMVRIYEKIGSTVAGGKFASDFYITSLAFEKIVSNFIGLLNGEILDANNPYPDFKPIA